MSPFLSPAGRRFLWALALFAFLAAGFVSFFLPTDPDGREPPVYVIVQPGLSSAGIARRLESAGVIRSRWAFQLVALIKGKTSLLKAGGYDIAGSETLWSMVDRIAAGDVADAALTIPEGLNAGEVADKVAVVLGCTREEFLKAVFDTAAAAGQGIPTRNFEGYLFPDTYDVIPGSPPAELVKRLVTRMTERFDRTFKARADSLGFSRHEVLTLASLVEAEAQVAHERPRIAAVFMNRLRAGMKLQSDPTVAFVIGGFMGARPARIYEKDLAVQSPYNTYVVTGLPPGPICSPGESSIRAALFPEPGCRDYYFVAAGDGSHLFSPTNDAHNEARRRVARNARSQEGKKSRAD